MKPTSPRNSWSKHITFLENSAFEPTINTKRGGGRSYSRTIEAHESVITFGRSSWVKGRNYTIKLRKIEKPTLLYFLLIVTMKIRYNGRHLNQRILFTKSLQPKRKQKTHMSRNLSAPLSIIKKICVVITTMFLLVKAVTCDI